MSTSFKGIGGIILGTYVSPFERRTGVKANQQWEKRLFATTDFFDNIVINHRGSRYGNPVNRTPEYYHKHKCFMDKAQLDELHRVLASIGVTRHQWIVDNIWTLYEDYPQGFDLLKEAVKSAHKYGIELYAEIKPFEGGGFSIILPHSMPFPEGAPAFKDMRGILPIARSFAVENFSMNLKRRPGTYNAIVRFLPFVWLKVMISPHGLKPSICLFGQVLLITNLFNIRALLLFVKLLKIVTGSHIGENVGFFI